MYANTSRGCALPKRYAVCFRSEANHYSAYDEHRCCQKAHRLCVRVPLSKHRLDIRRDARTEHSDLVRESRKESTQVSRRQFIHVSRNDAPGALHEELHEE